VTLDLVLLGLVAFFAVVGAFNGAAKQVATVAAGLIAWVAAGPVGRELGVPLAKQLGTSHGVGVVLATGLAFIVLAIGVRIALTVLLRRILAGNDPKNRSVDRALGFFLGGAKVALLSYVLLCVAAFVEDNVVIAGHRLRLAPKDSYLLKGARAYNLLETRQFKGAHELVQVAKVATNPQARASMKGDADLEALAKDPRFQRALSARGMQHALKTGDVTALLQNDQVLELISDPRVRERLLRLGPQVEGK